MATWNGEEVPVSSMSNWLKAGAVIVVLRLLGIVPCVRCVTWILAFIAYYGCTGALAACLMPPVPQTGPAAGQGTLARHSRDNQRRRGPAHGPRPDRRHCPLGDPR